MAQFDVYKNSNTQTNELFPYLLDINRCIGFFSKWVLK